MASERSSYVRNLLFVIFLGATLASDYLCEDGREVSPDMEAQCLDMHIEQSEYGSAEEAFESATERVVLPTLQLATMDFEELYRDKADVRAGPARTRQLHVIQRISWRPEKENVDRMGLTGLFRTGSNFGYIRYSISVISSGSCANKTSSAALETTSMVSVKLLRQGIASGNLNFAATTAPVEEWETGDKKVKNKNKVMDGEGQETRREISFSTHSRRTIAPGIAAPLCTSGTMESLFRKIQDSLFHDTVEFSNFEGTLDFALFTHQGKRVREPRVPFEVQLVPSEALMSRKHEGSSKEGDGEKAVVGYIEALLGKYENSKLFDVYAISKPKEQRKYHGGEGGEDDANGEHEHDYCVSTFQRAALQKVLNDPVCGWVKIGQIDALERPTISSFGDTLQFPPSRFSRDLQLEGAKDWMHFLGQQSSHRSQLSPPPSLLVHAAKAALGYGYLVFTSLASFFHGMGVFYGLIDPPPNEGAGDGDEGGGGGIEACPYMNALKAMREGVFGKEKEEEGEVSSDHKLPDDHPAVEGSKEDCPYLSTLKKQKAEEGGQQES